MDEESFIRRIAALFPQGPDVKTGPGDDCAVLDLGMSEFLLAAVDQVIESVHYLPGCTPEKAAQKLLKRNISDIASMGGVPTHALLSLALDPVKEEYLFAFHQGIAELTREYNISVIGGDMAKLPVRGQCFSLTILGKVEKEKLCLRSNAKVCQGLYGTGRFGNSFLSEHHLTFRPRLEEGRFLAGRYTDAMMDVSDGLLKDACRFAAASDLALSLDTEKIPLREGASLQGALNDGEDYELLFAMDDALFDDLKARWPFADVPVSRIGEFVPGKAGSVSGLDDMKDELDKTGYDHFR